ncbi:hypothetical protein [Pseudomonas gessardii]|uniref:hypothetical protein n=1 Tax=Pseudomonas gessardii TaxID=78544 RepID=UPI001475CEEC|nr:hypothetical protein [Pseudomonas gessardii]NNA69440.1 hypothetical protein [Pseudomonas gessardii]
MTTNQTIGGVPRGEPVYQVSDGVNGWSDVDLLRYTACCLDPEEYECRVLYAEHPAPVAVVLPARPRADEEEYERMTDYEKGLLHGGIELWDKIDEVTRLNPSL